jgi:4-amino-4-deoxy-L-arabinose transferase-like glycosyltransferase
LESWSLKSIPIKTHSVSWIGRIDPALSFALLYFLLLLPWLGKNRLLGLDESIYANVVLAAVKDHHWAPFYFLGKPFLEKPPLVTWIQSLCFVVFGASEWSLRLSSASATLGCLYFTFKIGERLGRSRWIGLSCAILLGLQEHFILFARLGTMDMPLLCCLCGGFWCLLNALRENETSRHRWLLMSGVWLSLGILCKAWFALAWMPAMAAMIIRNKSANFSFAQLFWRWIFPPSLAVFIWLAFYGLIGGWEYYSLEFGWNVLSRLNIGVIENLNALLNIYPTKFYADLAQGGLAFLWPLIPWALAVGIMKLKSSPEDVPLVGWGVLFFFLYYLLLLLCFTGTLINYLLPLLPACVLLLAFALRFHREPRVGLGLALAICIAAVNGWNRYSLIEIKLVLSFAAAAVSCLPARFFDDKAKGVFCLLALLLWLGAATFKAQAYWRNPPDPNGGLVEAVLAHPPRAAGEKLLFLGEHTDARAIQFYTSYQVVVWEGPWPSHIRGPALIKANGKAVFIP